MVLCKPHFHSFQLLVFFKLFFFLSRHHFSLWNKEMCISRLLRPWWLVLLGGDSQRDTGDCGNESLYFARYRHDNKVLELKSPLFRLLLLSDKLWRLILESSLIVVPLCGCCFFLWLPIPHSEFTIIRKISRTNDTKQSHLPLWLITWAVTRLFFGGQTDWK